jgi:hypothetical protein
MRRRSIRSSGELKRVAEKLRCGHVFHRHCILPWFMNIDNEASDNCPMCRQHIRFSNKVGMFNGRLFSRKIYLWNMAQLDREDVDNEEDNEYAYDQDDGQDADTDNGQDADTDDGQDADTDNGQDADTDNGQLSSISSDDTDTDTHYTDWFDAEEWTNTTPPDFQYSYSWVKFAITQQKLTLTKLHAMRFNRFTNNICRNRHR